MEGEGALGEGRGGVSDNDNVIICEPAVPNPTFVEDKIAATRAYEPHPARVAAGRATSAKKADRLRALRERLQRAREANERKKESLRERLQLMREAKERKKRSLREPLQLAREANERKKRSLRERLKKRENVATDLNSPTEPKGFPNGLTAEEKEWIMQDGLMMFFGDDGLARGERGKQVVGDMWRRMAWEKFGQEWFDACEADESILYYEHPQPNYDKWYLRLRDRETVVQDNGMYEITTITEYGHEADQYRASKKLPAGATECEWAGRKYKLHNYSPPFERVYSTKKISFEIHLKCLWDVVEAAWNMMCDEVDVPSDVDVRRFLYRPGRIMSMSEPECWDCDPNDRKYDRKTTIQAAKEFCGNFLGLMMKHFEGADHVRRKCDWPEDWTDKRKEEYSEAFKKVVDKQCKVRDGRSWSLIPILHDKRTRVVDMVVDRIGDFLKSPYVRALKVLHGVKIIDGVVSNTSIHG